MSLVVSVAVLKWFRPWSMAAWLLAITPPLRSVLPATSIWKPPSPALMPLCSATPAKSPSTQERLSWPLMLPPPAPRGMPTLALAPWLAAS
jgi:hypothetical protein